MSEGNRDNLPKFLASSCDNVKGLDNDGGIKSKEFFTFHFSPTNFHFISDFLHSTFYFSHFLSPKNMQESCSYFEYGHD